MRVEVVREEPPVKEVILTEDEALTLGAVIGSHISTPLTQPLYRVLSEAGFGYIHPRYWDRVADLGDR